MEILKIANREIGHGKPVFVIAEIGVNHDGRLDRAIELARVAADCGADAVKLQLFQADRLMHPSAQFADYQKAGVDDHSPVEMLRRFELSQADVTALIAEINRLGLIALATPFSCDDVETIESFSLPAIKIASPDLVNWPLLRRAAAARMPLLISTGAATMGEIQTTVGWLNEFRAPAALLHCVSSYPTPAAMAHLGWIGELARFNLPVGYSDHTTELIAGALATVSGACIIEKHITYDRGAPGPDHSASADPEQFAAYVKNIRLAELMRGTPGKCVLDIERDVRSVSRQSLVATRALPAGHLLGAVDLTAQRPGSGISAAALPSLIGRKLSRNVSAGQMLDAGAIEEAA